tara:strand:+ start:594 stop:785 length:192 start_codon:yes stop_codon:yes gene_type:complete
LSPVCIRPISTVWFLHPDDGVGHRGEKEQPSITLIKLGGSPSSDRNFFFSPRIDGVESKSALV